MFAMVLTGLPLAGAANTTSALPSARGAAAVASPAKRQSEGTGETKVRPIAVTFQATTARPGAPIDLASKAPIAVAVLGTSTFDPRTIDPSTLTLSGAPVIAKKKSGGLKSAARDVNKDGIVDLVVGFRPDEMHILASDTRAVLWGKTLSGENVYGVQQLNVVNAIPPTAEAVAPFCNTNGIQIPIAPGTSGPANPYPAQLVVSGLTGTIADIDVDINNLTHGFPDDVNIVLVGPTGQSVYLLGDAGNGFATNNVSLVFDDEAAAMIPDEGPIVPGTYLPSVYGTDVFPAPAPAGPYGTSLTAFEGTNPNGTWSLYVLDDAGNDVGNIGGFCLNITTCVPFTFAPVAGALAGGTVGTAYTAVDINVTGANGATTFAVTTGALPGGLTLNTTTGVISGTPTAAGTFTFTVTATDFAGCTSSAAYSIVVGTACPTFAFTPVAGTLAAGTLGAAYTAVDVNVTNASGATTFAVTTGALPGGLTLNTTTGVISGTPTATGTFTFTITATDAAGCTGTVTYTIVVGCPTFAFTPAAGTLTGGTVGTAYAAVDVNVTNASGATTFAVTTGVLPGGLTLNTTTGVISGTPTTAGTFNFTLTATDAAGCTGTVAYTIVIGCPTFAFTPAAGTLAAGTTGTAYTAVDVNVTNASGATTFALTTGALPTGLTLNTTTGVISGTPTATGTFTFTITATDAAGCTGTVTYTIVVGCPTFAFTPAAGALPGGTFGTAYTAVDVNVTNATGATTFALTGGALPTGITLNTTTGVISGTPTAAGNFTFTITATDAAGCTGTVTYTLAVGCPTFVFSPVAGTLAAGTTGTAYTAVDVNVTNATGATTFALTTGTLPTGLTLNTTTGVISGTPTAAGTFTFTLTATDAAGCTGTVTYTIVVACPTITVNPATLPNPVLGTAYNQTVTQTGGTGAIAFAVSAGALPTGLTLNPTTGAITGTPTTAGTFNFTIRATDANGCIGTRAYTVTVACPVFAFTPVAGTLAAGTTGVAYTAVDVNVTNATGATTFALTTGTLPTGLTLNTTTGVISGTPTAAGTFTFTLTATDAAGCTGTVTYTIVVACPTITVNPTTLAQGALGVAYNQAVSATGGMAPYTFAVSAGALPGGLTLNPTTGALAGTPTAAGTFNFTIRATDANGCIGTRAYTLFVTAPPTAICHNVTVAAGANCTATASINNGSFDPDGGTVTVTQNPAGPYALGNTTVTLTVTDDEGQTATCTAVVTVADQTGPAITCPANITVTANTPTGIVVNYTTPTAADNCSAAGPVTCTPASGTFFPNGTTTVTCTSTDVAGNIGRCTFNVVVARPTFDLCAVADENNTLDYFQANTTTGYWEYHENGTCRIYYGFAETITITNFSITLRDQDNPVTMMSASFNRRNGLARVDVNGTGVNNNLVITDYNYFNSVCPPPGYHCDADKR